MTVTVGIKAAVGSDLEFDKVILAYRPKDAPEFLAREMTKNGKGWYSAEIPSEGTAGDVVAYYIEKNPKSAFWPFA